MRVKFNYFRDMKKLAGKKTHKKIKFKNIRWSN